MSYQGNAKFSVNGNLVLSLVGDRVTVFDLMKWVCRVVVSVLSVLG